MKPTRPGTAGATRTCPHCKSTILESSVVCPACKHHLRFDPSAIANVEPAVSALSVEGTVRQPLEGDACEYTMVLSIRNDRGEEIDRKLVGVGAMRPGEGRTFALSVEIHGGAKSAGNGALKH